MAKKEEEKIRAPLFTSSSISTPSTEDGLNAAFNEYAPQVWCVGEGEGGAGGSRNTTLIFRIPWSCYSARLSNDQLFGPRQAFLRSLSLIIAIEYERRRSLHSSTKENPCL